MRVVVLLFVGRCLLLIVVCCRVINVVIWFDYCVLSLFFRCGSLLVVCVGFLSGVVRCALLFVVACRLLLRVLVCGCVMLLDVVRC